MATQLGNTGVTFDDATTQNTASDYKSTTYTSSSTYVKPANLKAIRVTVIGGGGSGGSATGAFTPQGKVGVALNSRGGSGGGGGSVIAWIDAPSIPASPVAVTVGGVAGTSSFGALASATGGASGTSSGSNQNLGGGAGGTATLTPSATINGLVVNGTAGSAADQIAMGGGTIYGSGGVNSQFGGGSLRGIDGSGRGSGGSGAVKSGTGTIAGGVGRNGVVIVEEFF